MRDLWREVGRASRRAATTLKLSWKGVLGLSDGEVLIAGPLTVICGENGAGKSTLMRLLLQGVRSVCANFVGLQVEQGPSADSLALQVPRALETGVEWVPDEQIVRDYLFDDSVDAMVALYHPALQVPLMLDKIRADANFRDVLVGVEPISLSEEDLRKVNYILGKDYNAVEIFEIDAFGERVTFPYFQVTCSDGTSYFSETMGLGELAALTAFWIVRSIPVRSILLVEELETFLAPNSRMGLLNHLAEEAIARNLLVVVTAHSGNIVERVPGSNVLHLSRYQGDTLLVKDPGAAILSGRLGLVPARRLILMVEDVVAKYVVEALLDALAPRAGASGEFVVCGGCGEISRALDAVPFTDLRATNLVGIYDGDTRKEQLSDSGWPVLQLPGADCPEDMIANFLKGKRAEELAPSLQFDLATIQTALAASQGLDPHDHLLEVARVCGVHPGELVRRVIRAMCSADDKFGVSFVRNLEHLLLPA